MYQPVHAIVMRIIRYNDSQMIVTLYTRECGRMACLSPAGTSREAARRRALLMPLSPIECMVDIRPGRELHAMRDLRTAHPLHSLTADPLKASIALFMADVANTVLREPQADELMYDFMLDTALALDGSTRPVANHHICFLMRLLRFMGIEPDWGSYRRGWLLDLQEGYYRPDMPLHRHYLSGSDAEYAHMLSRITPRNAHLYRLSAAQRNAIIDCVIDYFTLHDVRLNNLSTLDILRQLF